MQLSLVGLLQAAAVITLVFSVVTALPIDHYAVQLFTHFKVQYLAVSILLGAALAWFHQPVYAGAMLVAIAINAALVMPWYVSDSAPLGDHQLKILHANVLWSNTEYDRLLGLVESANPDVIMLQEVSPQWRDALVPLHAEYPYSYIEARPGAYGIALLSRLPVNSVSHVDSPPSGSPTIVATLELGGETLHLVGTHPTIPIRKGLYKNRNIQLASIVELLNARDGSKVMIGDLNASVWDMNYRSLEAETGLRNTRTGFGVLPTWPTHIPFAMIPIDHVLVSDDISVVEMRRGPRIGSDHLPLIVTIAL